MIRLWTMYELEPLTLTQLNELDSRLHMLLAEAEANTRDRDFVLASLANIKRVRKRQRLPRALQ